MKFTLSWLKDHLDTTASLQEIADTLTAIGLEVESITDRSEELKPFTVARVKDAQPHPDADKLRVCKVESDVGELQIVCGAPNARAGIFVALAKEGAVIPANGMVIKKSKIRGVESNGMLCSSDELAIGEDSAGIIELPEAPIGSSVAELLGLNDPTIEIAITPNRADCLGVYGIARDLAAAGLGTLLPLPHVGEGRGEGSFESPISVTIENTAKCPQFIGATIKDVTNKPSPDWLANRLRAIGQKPISALVDVTNYITHDLGRPLHVFDAATLKGNITVRDAKDGETLDALNDKKYSLSAGMTVVADEAGPQGLGGVIGGTPTGCQLETTDVFLEVALFNPTHIAETGRTLQIDSDARYRFERGVDVAFVEQGALLAIRLIQQLCGGEASHLVLAGGTPDYKRSIAFDPARTRTLGGVDIAADKATSILESLGFAVSSSSVTPPSWRADVEGEADLVEEILRIHGYDHIPVTPLPKPTTMPAPALNASQKRTGLAKRLLAARGFMEACTWSFLPEKQAKIFGGAQEELKLLNPISADLDTMRPSLLPNLIDAARRNANRGMKNLALCEVGLQFSGIKPDQQQTIACGIRVGSSVAVDYNKGLMTEKAHAANAFDVKNDALAVLESLGLNKADITTDTPSWYHPGRSGAITLGGKIILGYFGELHPAVLKELDIDLPVAGFELLLDNLPTPRAKTKAKPSLQLSDYQAVERDFAFIVDASVSAADIIKSISKADKKLITDVRLFDVYMGKGVDDGKKSVAIQITLQAMDRTLTEEDIKSVSDAVVAAAAKDFGGALRA